MRQNECSHRIVKGPLPRRFKRWCQVHVAKITLHRNNCLHTDKESGRDWWKWNLFHVGKVTQSQTEHFAQMTIVSVAKC